MSNLLSAGTGINLTTNPYNQTYTTPSYDSTFFTTKNNCTELYKQLLWYNVKKFGKDIITEEQHKNMLSMLNSNDNDTLELLRQILIGKAIE